MFSEFKKRLTVSISLCVALLLVFHFFTAYFSYSKILLESFSEKDDYSFSQTAINYKTVFNSIESSADLFLNYIASDFSYNGLMPSIRTMQSISGFSYGISNSFLFCGSELLAFSSNTCDMILPNLLKDEKTMLALKESGKCWTYIKGSNNERGSLAFVTGITIDAFAQPVYLAVMLNSLLLQSMCTEHGYHFRSHIKTEFELINGYTAEIRYKNDRAVCHFVKSNPDSSYDKIINLENGMLLKLNVTKSYITLYLLILLITLIFILILSLYIMKIFLNSLNENFVNSLTELYDTMQSRIESSSNNNI